MQTHFIRMSLFMAGLVSVLWPLSVNATPLDKLTVAEERQAVEKCLALIQARRLDRGVAKGAFRVATNTGAAWIEHYFALEAMLALLAATDDPKAEYATWVGEYLTFYATDALKQPQGVAHNYGGPQDNPQHIVPSATEKAKGLYTDYDSIDSYAGLFLLVSARYHKLTGKLPPQVPEALLVSLKALNRVVNDKKGISQDGGYSGTFIDGALTNGLSIARAESPIHFLMDAVETHAGLREAVGLFQETGCPAEAAQAQALADGVAKGSALFAPTQNGELYANKVDNGNIRYFDANQYPGVLANLFALSYLSNQDAEQTARVWRFVNGNQAKIGNYTSQAPEERWLIAATRVEPDKDRVKVLRQLVTTNATRFGPATYIDRLAITILALLGGSSHYPTIPRF